MYPAPDRAKRNAADSVEDLIRGHYDHFNERRVAAAERHFHPDARVEHITGRVERGPDGFRQFAERWLNAFPDGRLIVESIRRRAPGMYDVDLVATGTHKGTLAFETWIFRPTNVEIRLSARELLQIEDGRVHFASLAFDVQDLVRQLARVDIPKLLDHLTRIHQLSEQLAAAESDPSRQRELIDRLGRQLDAARHVVRPYFQ